MKKILVTTMIIGAATGIIGCTKYKIVPVDSAKNNNAIEEQSVAQNNNSSTNTNMESKYTMEQAKEIALNHANLTNEQVIFGECEMEYDNGIQIYEIEFRKNSLEYNYEINANTGELISFEQD